MECCGATIVGINSEIPLMLTKEKLNCMKEAGAQALITICPSCHLMFDANQPRIERKFGEKIELPVLHYPQLFALSAGINPEDLGLKEHKIDATEKMVLFC
jgi:heterodisulfide reductase subunit B